MPNFYQQPPHRDDLPAPSISKLGEPEVSEYSQRTHFSIPDTEEGMKAFCFTHIGMALVELDRVLYCLEKLGMKAPATKLTKTTKALDDLRDVIEPPAKKYRNGLKGKAK